MKKSKRKIILNAIMVAGLLATSGCWTQHGSQGGGGGQVGGSFGASGQPAKTSGTVASSRANHRVSGQGAQLAMNDNGHSVSSANP